MLCSKNVTFQDTVGLVSVYTDVRMVKNEIKQLILAQ